MDETTPQAPFMRSVLPKYGTLEYVQKLAITILTLAALIYMLGHIGRGGIWSTIRTGAALK